MRQVSSSHTLHNDVSSPPRRLKHGPSGHVDKVNVTCTPSMAVSAPGARLAFQDVCACSDASAVEPLSDVDNTCQCVILVQSAQLQ